ncbi:MAG: metallophosphoesterase family protein [Chloroflexota bacterium]
MARIAVISDIHSNLAALEAVIRDAGTVDGWWCLGDIVGYGPEPNEVITAIQDLGAQCIRGNHDDGVQQLDKLAWFQSTAGVALNWTAHQLTPSSWQFIRSLPEDRVCNGYRLVHGSPRDALVEYVTSARIAEASLRLIEDNVCFIGHTHVPSSFIQPAGRSSVDASHRAHGESIRIEPGARYMLNAGSVGQPRDGDTRAAYGILDTERSDFTWYRAPYGIGITQKKMRAAALPSILIDRLSKGW